MPRNPGLWDGIPLGFLDVHDLGEIHLEDGQEQFHANAADVKILYRRNADHRRRIHRVLAMRDGDCEKIRAGIPAAARRVNANLVGFRPKEKRPEVSFVKHQGRRNENHKPDKRHR